MGCVTFHLISQLCLIGWEYTVNPTYGVYGAVVKAYHMFRRRRLVRMRRLVDPKATKKQDQLQKLLAEGWGYAPLFNMKFHAKEKKMDFCRRRRWLMKMVPISGEIDGFSCKLPPILRVQLKSKVFFSQVSSRQLHREPEFTVHSFGNKSGNNTQCDENLLLP